MQATSLQCQWTSRQALILVTICLSVGIAGGWLIRGFQGTTRSSTAQTANPLQASPATLSPTEAASQQPNATQLKQMADSQAAPLRAKLKTNPRDPDTLTAIGNLYYDAQQYPMAVDYYGRTLQYQPSNASVRTDMATAYWYMGNTDEAIAQFNKALTYAPNNPNTLFNLGLVKWQAKHDSVGAIADWQKLLNANPNYEQKDKVLQMLSEARKQSTVRGSTKS